jgi:hypothetical protein
MASSFTVNVQLGDAAHGQIARRKLESAPDIQAVAFFATQSLIVNVLPQVVLVHDELDSAVGGQEDRRPAALVQGREGFVSNNGPRCIPHVPVCWFHARSGLGVAHLQLHARLDEPNRIGQGNLDHSGGTSQDKVIERVQYLRGMYGRMMLSTSGYHLGCSCASADPVWTA